MKEPSVRKNVTVRSCLKCGKPFESEGSGNRLCSRCFAANADVSIPRSPGGRLDGRRGIPEDE